MTGHGWPPVTEWLLAVVVFLIPWQARWIWFPQYLNGSFWEYGSGSISVTEVLLWVCLALAAGHLLKTFRRPRPPVRPGQFFSPAGALYFGSTGLVVVAWLTLVWAPDRSVALQAAFRLTEAVALFTVILLARPAARFLAMQAWVVAAALQGALVMTQFFTQQVWQSTWWGMNGQTPGELGASVLELADGRWLRAYGTFPHPNILAGFLALGILFAVRWYVRRYRHADRIAALACGIISGLGLVLSFSRSGGLAAVLGMLVGIVAAIFWHHRKEARQIFRFAVLVGAVAAVALFLVLPEVKLRVSGAGRLEIKSSVERQALLDRGFAQAAQSFPLGVGCGNTTVAAHLQNPTQPGFAYQPPHNVGLLVAVELGIFGAAALAVTWLGAAWLSLRRRLAISFGVVAALSVLAWFDHYLWTLVPGVLMLWTGLALAASAEEGNAGD